MNRRAIGDAPVAATAILAETAEALVRAILADHPREKTISLPVIPVSQLEKHARRQRELPPGLADEIRRPGARKGMARLTTDRAVDAIRDRFGWEAMGCLGRAASFAFGAGCVS